MIGGRGNEGKNFNNTTSERLLCYKSIALISYQLNFKTIQALIESALI